MSVRAKALPALSLLLACGSLAACGDSTDSSGTGEYVDGQTFTLLTARDPGNLDPHASFDILPIAPFAYDALVALGPDGTILPQLAESWKVTENSATFELRDDVTCSDGSAFDAQTAVDNLEYVANIENLSPIRGVFLPVDVSATASGSTVTVSYDTLDPFFIEGIAYLPMVCASGLQDRDGLRAATAGTGPYTLTEAVPGDRYTFAVREDYVWGPDGASTSETGTPAVVEVQVVANETTTANLLLSGEANSAMIVGTDGDRLAEADIDALETEVTRAALKYNQGEGRIANDRVVRIALTQAIDRDELRHVITAGKGVPPSKAAVYAPGICEENTIDGNVPEHDPAAAAEALAAEGWVEGSDGVLVKDGTRLELTLIYVNAEASETVAAELAVTMWGEIGVDVTARGMSAAEMPSVLYETGDWDIAWGAVGVSNPRLITPFASGPPPAGGGANYAHISNPEYEAHVQAAMTQIGNEGCPDWDAAEIATFRDADYVPFANNMLLTFHQGVVINQLDSIFHTPAPTGIRMLG